MKPKFLFALSAALSVAACGGGELFAGIDAGGGPQAPSAVIVSKGTISGFGSVTVNGVTFDTSNTNFTIDGIPGTQSDLAVGEVVIVRGTLDDGATTGVAEVVIFDDVVEGPIEDIDLTAQTLTILGQLARVDADTSFDDSIAPASLAGLAVDDVVEISGLILSDGSIGVTRIELKPAAGELELTGIVSNASGTTFEINGFVVDFSGATAVVGFPNGTPEDGQRVEAKGDSLGASGELLATRVEFKGGDLGDSGDRGELEGYVTRFASLTDFDVEGVPVTSDAQTTIENGAPGDVALNRKIEVEGDIRANGVLDADTIKIKSAGVIRVESLVEAVQADQLTVLGIVIGVDATTRYEDKSAANVDLFGIADIDVGDYVEIRGFESAGGVVATLIEREDFNGEVALRGIVDSINDPQFSILGVTITTGAGTQFRDLAGSIITAAEFFSQANGRLVEASGTLNGSMIDASEVQFEN